jgi:coenzyme F420-reducing hydrogenase beta subunit
MIDIKRKEECCGCGACYDSCNSNAIVWMTDEEGFSYPSVNRDVCTDCGLCERVCPIINKTSLIDRHKDYSPTVYGVYHKDDEIRVSSTSGGAFWGLAEGFVKTDGYVSGAIFHDHFHVRHYLTNDLEELKKIKGSKYVQSDCRGIYRQIKKILMSGGKVMATGLPCQIAALHQYLGKEYENLITVDLICHSVPSPMVFERYISYLEDKYGSTVAKYHPKNKEYGGWHKYAFKATFENGKVYHKNGYDDKYVKAFVGSDNICARPSCFECPFKNVPQPSDITIGDFWGIDKIDPSFDSPKGVSKIVVNSAKGAMYFDGLNSFESRQYDVDVSIYNNPPSYTMLRAVNRPDAQRRSSFMKDVKEIPFDKCISKYYPVDRTKKFKDSIFKIKRYVRSFFTR